LQRQSVDRTWGIAGDGCGALTVRAANRQLEEMLRNLLTRSFQAAAGDLQDAWNAASETNKCH